MSTLLIKLNGAPDDEVGELRELLTEHAIDFYETDAGRWGISVAAIWLHNEMQLEHARVLVERYQQGRAQRVREEHALQRQAGLHETLLSRLIHNPLKVLLYLSLIIVVLYLSLMPFIGTLL